MAWVELTADEYAKDFASPHACYLRADFNRLNAAKVDAVRFFAYAPEGSTSGYRLGLAVGEKGGEWMSPYSAPFGGFACAKGVAIDEIDEAVKALPAFVAAAHKKLHVTLAPVFYSQTFLTKCVSSMFRAGFALDYADLNYAFDFTDAKPYEKRLWNMAKRNLKQASARPYELREETTPEGIAVCYDVIRQNREHKGYPLKMSLKAFEKTSSIVPIRYYTLYLDGTPVATAIVYHVSSEIFQLIYWGDAPGFEESRPMNVLASKMFEHFKALGADYLDIGPSSEDGVPNVGLCAFKESVGCSGDLKYTFVYDGSAGSQAEGRV